MLPAQDHYIRSIATSCPQLTLISLKQVILTDAAFTAIAGLRHLVDLSIVNEFAGQFTTDAVLAVLRGNSRHFLHQIRIKTGFISYHEVNQERNKIREETGRPVNVTIERLDGHRDAVEVLIRRRR
jgi:hypothetical protein